jgi:hypothetical protein
MYSKPNRFLSGLDPKVTPSGFRLGMYAPDPRSSKSANRPGNKIELLTTEWVSHFVRIKDGDTGLVKPVEFSERKYLERPYNSGTKRILLVTSRQTEKSTSVGNKLLANAGMKSNYVSLFVSPSAMQTSVFSKARLDDIIDISPNLKALTHTSLTMNILEKEFLTGSKIYLRYAFLSADRIRGLSVNALFADEIQDLLRDVMPVIEETTSRFANSMYVYSGTPKSLDNTIEHYWSRSSTQNEWAIPCERHGASPGTWHWNVLGLENLGKTGPICDRCGGPLNPEHPAAGWVQMSPGAEFEGFRICRLMVPWFYKNPDKWKDILKAFERYPKAQFMNEVMATSYDSGTKPLTSIEMMRACDSKYINDEDSVAKIAESWQLYAGIDWGTGENTYTVITIGGYVRAENSFQILYSRRFDGQYVEPDLQLAEIERLIRRLNVKFIGADYGGGFVQNKHIVSRFGPQRVHTYQYQHKLNAKVQYKPVLHRNLVFRSAVMADVFNAIKKLKIRFPSWETYKQPYADDCLSIVAEYSDSLRMIKYDTPRGVTDDTFHSVLYCLLASMLDRARPDIISPIQETDNGMGHVDEGAIANQMLEMVDPQGYNTDYF